MYSIINVDSIHTKCMIRMRFYTNMGFVNFKNLLNGKFRYFRSSIKAGFMLESCLNATFIYAV